MTFKTKILGAIFAKIKAYTAILRRFSQILLKFLQIWPDFHQIKSIGGASAPEPPTPVILRDAENLCSSIWPFKFLSCADLLNINPRCLGDSKGVFGD